MIRKSILRAVVGAGLALTSTDAFAADFDGSTIGFQVFFPTTSAPISTFQSAVVGAGVEFPSDSLGFYGVDLSGSTFVITDLFGGNNVAASFNGFILNDVGNSLAAITGVTFTGGGLAGEQPVVTFDDDHIYANFNVIPQTTRPGVTYSYAVTFAGAVPEPASWMMMIGGFGLVGGALRRRQVRVAFAA